MEYSLNDDDAINTSAVPDGWNETSGIVEVLQESDIKVVE